MREYREPRAGETSQLPVGWRLFAAGRFLLCLMAVSVIVILNGCGGNLPQEPEPPEVVPVGSFLLKPYIGATPPACDVTAPPVFGPLVAGTPYNVLVVALNEGGTALSDIFDGIVELSTTDPYDSTVLPKLAEGGCVIFQNLLAVTAGTGFRITADTPEVRGVRTSSTPYDITSGPASRLAVRVIGPWNGATPPDPAVADQQIVPSATGPIVVGTPARLTAGNAFDVEIVATDSMGNAAAGAPSVDVFAPFDPINVPPQSGGPGTYTFTIYRASSTQRVSANDQASVLQRGDSSYFSVAPEAGGAAGLALLLPGQTLRPTSGGGFLDPSPILVNPKVGQSFAARVTAIDIYGNNVSTASDTVTLSNLSAPGVQIPIIRKNLALGQASFSVNARAALLAQQISAAGLVLPGTASDTFDIDPPDPAVVAVNLGGVVAGQGYLGGTAAYRYDSSGQVPDPGTTGHEYGVRDYAAVATAGDGLVTSTSSPWTRRTQVLRRSTPGIEPDLPPRSELACAYDATRQQVVFFGGSDGGVPFDDTWEWDGSTLDPVSPLVSSEVRPVARSAHGMIHVPGQGVAVFGGLSAQGRLNDLWLWDGSTWTEPPQSNPPSPRLGAAVSFDTVESVLIVFGGDTASGLTNELWLNDGTGWSQAVAVGAIPAARAGAVLVYDSLRGVHVLVGGRQAAGLVGDHHELFYNGSDWEWVRRDGTELPIVPPGRTAHTAGFDPVRGVVIVHGGLLDPGVPGTSWIWEFDDAGASGPEWSTPVAAGLPALAGSAGCFDTLRGYFVIAGGGTPGSALSRNIYRWDSGLIQFSVDRARSVSGPADRSGAAMAYLDTDSEGFPTQRAFLFGGRTGQGHLTNDLWTLDTASGLWSQLAPVPDDVNPVFPPPMERAKLMADTGRNVLVLYGGEAGAGGVTDIWDLQRDWRSLSGSQFQMNGTVLTIPSNDGALNVELVPGDTVDINGTLGVIDSIQGPNTATIVTPVADTGVQAVALKLVWEWLPWVKGSPVQLDPPSERAGPAAAYDAANGNIVVFGGQTTASGLSGETWFWNGTEWSRLPVSGFPRPLPRTGAAMNFDPVTGTVILYGGQSQMGFMNDTWSFDGAFWTRLDSVGSTPPQLRDATLVRVDPHGLLLVGGTGPGGESPGAEWFWDGANWHRLDALGSTNSRPGAAAAYDPLTEQAVWYGGAGRAGSELELMDIPFTDPWGPHLDQVFTNRYAVEFYDVVVPVPQSGILTVVEIIVTGGGTGPFGDGTDLHVQRADGSWDYAAGHSYGPAFCPADPVDPAGCASDHTLNAVLPADTYFVNGRVRFAVSASSPSSEAYRSLQSTDFAEVRVSYLP